MQFYQPGSPPDENGFQAYIVKTVSRFMEELIDTGHVKICSKNPETPFAPCHTTEVFYDMGEGIYQLKGDYLIKDMKVIDPIHALIVRSVLYSATAECYRFVLADGGRGRVVPLFVDVRDKSIEKHTLL